MNWTEAEYEALKNRRAGASRRLPEAKKSKKAEGAFDPFQSLLEASGLPQAVSEFKFHPGRRWKFDYAWEAEKVALEVEGGAFTSGRHTRGQGFIDDMEKYNAAVCLGWKLLRFTPEQLAKGECLPTLRILFREL